MFGDFGKYKKVYSHLFDTYGRSWQVCLSFILQIISRACKFIFLPIAISLIIANLSVQDFDGAYRSVYLFVAFSLTLGILTPMVQYLGMKGENPVYQELTGSYFSRLITSDIEYLNSHLAGYLTAATRHYVDAGVTLVRVFRDRFINTILGILLPLVVIFWVDIVLGFVALGLSIVQAVYLVWASHAISPYRTMSRELYKKNSGRIADVVSNILAVRSFAMEEHYANRARRDASREADVFTKRYGVQAKLIGVRTGITVIFFMILLWLVVERMSGGALDIAEAVLIVTYTGTILTGIQSLSSNLDEHDDLVDKIVPAFEILDRQNKICDLDEPATFDHVGGEIVFDHISFSYYEGKKGQNVFDGFSLRIPEGQKLGVVGLSGAGKSTITKLLLRFNDVDRGRVLIDGVDIRDVRQQDLRRQISYVPQEPLLFHASIKDNVLLSDPDASVRALNKALRSAHAFDFIQRLPDGVDSIVGERGVKLSGGQKQRVAIARAVLQSAPIIILDEATSALDSESEQIIKDSFSEILKGKTAIVVAHRLSTLSDMDRIIVIEDGKIAEDGTHASLLRKRGVYANMWKRQLRHEEG